MSFAVSISVQVVDGAAHASLNPHKILNRVIRPDTYVVYGENERLGPNIQDRAEASFAGFT